MASQKREYMFSLRRRSNGQKAGDTGYAEENHRPEEDRKNLLVRTENPHQIGKTPTLLAGVFRSVHDALDEIVKDLPFLVGQIGQLNEHGLDEVVPA